LILKFTSLTSDQQISARSSISAGIPKFCQIRLAKYQPRTIQTGNQKQNTNQSGVTGKNLSQLRISNIGKRFVDGSPLVGLLRPWCLLDAC
jgi:hypothetical protein